MPPKAPPTRRARNSEERENEEDKPSQNKPTQPTQTTPDDERPETKNNHEAIERLEREEEDARIEIVKVETAAALQASAAQRVENVRLWPRFAAQCRAFVDRQSQEIARLTRELAEAAREVEAAKQQEEETRKKEEEAAQKLEEASLKAQAAEQKEQHAERTDEEARRFVEAARGAAEASRQAGQTARTAATQFRLELAGAKSAQRQAEAALWQAELRLESAAAQATATPPQPQQRATSTDTDDLRPAEAQIARSDAGTNTAPRPATPAEPTTPARSRSAGMKVLASLVPASPREARTRGRATAPDPARKAARSESRSAAPRESPREARTRSRQRMATDPFATSQNPSPTSAPAAAADGGGDDDTPATATQHNDDTPATATQHNDDTPATATQHVNVDAPLNTACARVFFDGGFHANVCAAGAFHDATRYKSKKIGGSGRTAHLAEVFGAILALDLAIELLTGNSSLEKLDILGDNYNVINTLAMRTVSFKAVAGRSETPGAWARALDSLDKLDRLLATRVTPCTVEFIWIPRRFNVNADEICNSVIEGRAPVFRTDVAEPPKKFNEPTREDLDCCFKRVLTTRPTCIRSLPTFLKTLWHHCLSHIAAWDLATYACLIAPRVILVRRGKEDDLRDRLAQYAKSPQLLMREFWHFAYSDEVDETPPSRSDVASVNWSMVERVAAQAPARALKMIDNARRTVPQDDVISQLRDKAGTPGPALESFKGVARPRWQTIDAFLSIAARRLGRLASPGLDGWTRELFLSSVCRGTSAALEQLLNAILRGDLLTPLPSTTDPTTASRVAAWSKDGSRDDKGREKARVIGMSSALAKIAWQAGIQAHPVQLRQQHSFLPGGVIAIIRWLEREGEAFTADYIDAYWRVARSKVLKYLVARKSPLAWLFQRFYGQDPLLEYRGTLIALHEGVLPGCGGAAFAFAVFIASVFDEAPIRPQTRMYADDGSSISADDFKKFCDAVGKENLAKFKIISTNQREYTIDGTTYTTVSAAKHLGAFIGQADAAVNLMRPHVEAKLKKLRTVIDAPLTCQAKWQLVKAVESSLVWDMSATRPEVTTHLTEAIDKSFMSAIAALLPASADLSHKSMTLLYYPKGSGGLGLTCFAQDANDIYAAATLRAAQEGDAATEITPMQLKRAVQDKKLDAITLPKLIVESRTDSSTPWFDIQHITKRTTISDEAFRLSLAHTIDVDVQYPVCPLANATDAGTTFDHSQTCKVCGSPYRFPRHQRIQSELIAVCNSYGIVASPNFFAIGVKVTEKHPDVIIYRGATREKPLVIDISVPHHAPYHKINSLKRTHAAKALKYKNFQAGAVQFKPFIISTRMHFEPRTLELLREIEKQAVRKGFVREVTKRIKAAMADFETYRRHALQLRANSGALVDAARKHQAKAAMEATAENDNAEDEDNDEEEFG